MDDSSVADCSSLQNPSLSEYLVDEIEKIKGDAIGNTLYSERSVLKTLIKLTKINEEVWNGDFETELCLLWDMSLEKDVVDFLLKNDFLDLSSVIIRSSSNVRLVEILVGIHGNISCILYSAYPVKHLLIMLDILYTSIDPQTLTQVLRLVQAVSWQVTDDYWLDSYPHKEKLSSHLAFLLASSTNDELLVSCLDLLNTLCRPSDDKDYSHFFSTSEVISGLLECWKQLFGNWNPEEDTLSKTVEKAAYNWCSIVTSFTSHPIGISCLNDQGEAIGGILSKLCLRQIDWNDSILPMCVPILEAIVKVYFAPNTFKKILKVFYDINQTFDDTDISDSSTALLLEQIGDYCLSIRTNIDSSALQRTLSDCNENHVLLFWKTVTEREPDYELVPTTKTI